MLTAVKLYRVIVMYTMCSYIVLTVFCVHGIYLYTCLVFICVQVYLHFTTHERYIYVYAMCHLRADVSTGYVYRTNI